MVDDPKIAGAVAGATRSLIVAAFNAVITSGSARNQRNQRRRNLALCVAHQLENYAIQCNDTIEIFMDAIQPLAPDYPSQIESDAYEFLDHRVVDRYIQLIQRPNRENGSAMSANDIDRDKTGIATGEWMLNQSMCDVRDEAVRLADDLRRRSGLRRRTMEWQIPKNS